MTITRIDRGEAFTTGGVSATATVVSSSFTPAPGSRLVVVADSVILAAANVLAVTDTFAGTSAWVEHTTVATGRSGYFGRLSIFSAVVGLAPGSGAVTTARSAGNVDQWTWHEVTELQCGPPAGTDADWNASTTSLTLDVPWGAASIIITGCANDQRTTADLTPPPGFTLSRNTVAPPAWGSEVGSAYRIGGSPAPQALTWTFPTTGSQINSAVAVEFIDAGPFNTPQVWRSSVGLR